MRSAPEVYSGPLWTESAGRDAAEHSDPVLQPQPVIGLPPQRQPHARLRLGVLVQLEIADHRAQRVRPGRAIDVAVGREACLQAAAERLAGTERTGIEAHHPLDLGRQPRRLGRAELTLGRADIAEHRVHARQFQPDAGGARLLVEDPAELHRRLAILVRPVREHEAQAEPRFAAQLDVGVRRERAIGLFGRDQIARVARLVGKGEKLGGRQVDGCRGAGLRRGHGLSLRGAGEPQRQPHRQHRRRGKYRI
jgi:hypothetical protein